MRLLRRIALCCAALLAFGVVALGAIQEAGAAGPYTPTASDFTNACPVVGADKDGCELLIVVDDTGAKVWQNTINDGTYDGSDDTLVGILNESSSAISSISLSSTSQPIYHFDGDGLCGSAYLNITSGCDPSGYAPPGVTFSNIDTTTWESATVNFATALTPTGGHNFFALEEALGTGDVTVTAPLNNTPPTIPGTPELGVQFQADPGTWSNTPTSYTYQFERCDSSGNGCASLGAPTSSPDYTPTTNDVGHRLVVVVTATNSSGFETVSSAASAIVTAPPSNTGAAPSISGTASVGDLLTASPGGWSGYPTPTFSYDWKTCTASNVCSTVQSGSSANYTPASGDEGLTVEVVVTASNNVSPDASATSAQTTAVTAAPTNNGAKPSISGTASVGDQLTASPGGWSGYPTPNFTYTWQDCTDPGAGSCQTVQSGSTNNPYTLTATDAGLFVRVLVSATNGVAPDGSAASATTTAVTQAPGNTQAPSISGTAQQGVALSGSAGTWTGVPTPTLTLQWEDCDSTGNGCAAVASNGNSLGYTPTSADVGHTLVLSVTASNSAGQLTVASAPTAAVLIAPPTNNTPPTITGGSAAQQDVQLAATNGTWNNSPTSFTYQWERCDVSGNACQSLGAGATSQTYTPIPADVGSTLRVIVTAINNGGQGSATSAQTATVEIGVPHNSGLPVISGKTQSGQTLQASLGTWVNEPSSYSFQWARCDFSGANCNDLGGQMSSQYVVVPGDIGGTLRVTVTAFNAGGHSAATSDPSEPVSVAAPVNTGAPSISGTVQQGKTLLATQGTWSNSPDSFAYQWQQCDGSGAGCGPIFGAKSSNYVPTGGDVGHTLRVIVSAHNSTGDAAATSSPTVAVLIAAPANTGLPQVTGPAQQGQTPAGSPGSWDNSPSTFTYQWLQCDAAGNACSPILGAQASTYSPAITDVGHTLRLQVTATNAGGSTTVTSGPSAIVEGLAASVPPPVFQQSANLSNVSGTILIKLPGSNTFVPLTNPIDVPDGSTIDATGGTVSLTTQLPNGTYQTGQFYSGAFTVGQTKTGTVDAQLSGGSFNGCTAGKTHGARAAAAKKKKKKTVVRQLWGNAHGNYTTKGRYGSASVSGTVWLTQDRCDGTFFKALKDDIYVIVFRHPHKRHHIKQGQTFFIPSH